MFQKTPPKKKAAPKKNRRKITRKPQAAPPPPPPPDLAFDAAIQAELDEYQRVRGWFGDVDALVQKIGGSLQAAEEVRKLLEMEDGKAARLAEYIQHASLAGMRLKEKIQGPLDRFRHRPLICCLNQMQEMEGTIERLRGVIHKYRELTKRMAVDAGHSIELEALAATAAAKSFPSAKGA